MKKKKFVIRGLVAVMSLLIIFSISACASKTAKSPSTVHDGTLGKNISLGMTKDQIDKLLGDPETDDTGYFYDNENLSVDYEEGKATMIMAFDGKWSAWKGVEIGTTVAQITSDFGAPSGDDFTMYYFKGSKQVTDSDDYNTVLYVSFSDGSVDSFAVSST